MKACSLPLDTLLFDEDAMKINVSYSVEKRNSYGGTSTSSVEDQIKSAKKYLNSK